MVRRALLLLPLILVACDHPTAADCRKAVENIDRLTAGMENDRERNPEAAVRACRARSSTAFVRCVIDAKTNEDLQACESKQKR